MGIASLIIGSLLLAGGAGMIIYLLLNLVKNQSYDKKKLCGLGLFSLIMGVGCGLVNYGYLLLNKVEPTGKDLSLILIFGILFFTFVGIAASQFVLYYYHHKLDQKLHKKIGIWLGISYGLLIVFFTLWLEGGSLYINYPMVSGFTIDGTGWHWTNFITFRQFNGLHIQFYALCILGGALFVYALCDHKFYQKYGEHGLLSSLFLVAFPAGIIGARIWYVVGNWTRDGFNQDFAKVFRIWDGGITIIGGAVFGILAGVLWVKFMKRDKFRVLDAVDIIVPTILIAQAIGRWGNFFNHEVFGKTIFETSEVWWLPTWFKYQMGVQLTDGSLSQTQFQSPLFFLEGVLNIAGYFLIVYGCKGINFLGKKHEEKVLALEAATAATEVLPAEEPTEQVQEATIDSAIINEINAKEEPKIEEKPKVKKKRRHYDTFLASGVIGSSYLIVYGTIRCPLELLRDSTYRMGENDMWSVINSAIMILLGIVCIILCFAYRRYKEPIDNYFRKLFHIKEKDEKKAKKSKNDKNDSVNK